MMKKAFFILSFLKGDVSFQKKILFLHCFGELFYFILETSDWSDQ